MQSAPQRTDEAASLQALNQLKVLDSGPEAEFDALVRAASIICGTPVALVSLIDADRQWFKANLGLPGLTETPRDLSFCAHAVLGDGLFEVPDALSDPRFADNPLVAGQPDIRFYAGAPVRLSDDRRIGTLCVIDRQPRQLTDTQRLALMELSTAVARALEGRQALLQLQKVAIESRRAALVLEHSGDAVIGLSPAGRVERWNPAAAALFGYTHDEIIGQPIGLLIPDAGPGPQSRESGGDDMTSRRSYEAVWRTRACLRVDVAVTLVPELDATGQVLGATKFVRDITQRKQQEAALQMSQEFLARAGSLAGVGGWAVDLLAMKLHWSDEVCRIHGVAPGHDPTLEQALAFYAPDSQPVITAAVQQAMTSGSTFDLELQIVRADGALRWVRTVGAADIVAGQPVRLVGAFQDITARVEANARLAESEARFRVLSDAAPLGVFATDAAGGCTYTNARWQAIYGLTSEQALGQGWTRTLHPEDHDDVFAEWQRTAELQTDFDMAFRVQRDDGTVRHVRSISRPTLGPAGDVLGYVGSVEDVTERVAQEQALRRSQYRVELATAAGGIGIWERDLASNTLSWDPLMHRLYGVPRGSERALVDLWRDCVHPDDLAPADTWLQAAQDNDGATDHKFRIVWPDGSVHFIHGSARVERDAQGRPVRMVGVNRDITELTCTELELRRSNAELEQFAYVASHDLQEPLRMVASYTEMLAQRYKGQLDERADKYIHYAVDGARRMQGLVNDLLAYSRVGAQGKPLVAVQTQPIVDAVCRSLQRVIDEAQAVIDCGPMPAVMGDPTQLSQLFQNLIGNALKFRAQEHVRIGIEAVRTTDRWLFTVRDNGIGMDMRYTERVFQMFQRLHERGKYEGSGIGLAITKRIVERHEGTIWFESAPGAGTTFFFTLKPLPAGAVVV